MTQKKSKLNIRSRQLVLLIAVVAVIVAAVVIFANRGAISDKLSTGVKTVDYGGEPFTFESGSMQVCASIGNGMALCSTNGVQLLDAGGKTVVRQVYSMDTPALAASDVQVAAFDVGGKELCVADLKGNCTELKQDNTIINLTMNKNGWFAVCTEATGYKGQVTVYNADKSAVYQWSSGDGYVISASVSPDNKYMAALCMSPSGSAVHIFSLSSEKEQAAYSAAGKLLTDMRWLGDNRICLLSQTDCSVIDRGGELKGTYNFGGMYLTDYTFGGDGYAVLMLSKYRSGGTGTLTCVGADGKLMGQTQVESETLALDAKEKTIAVLCQDGVKLFTTSLTQTGTGGNVAGVKTAVVRSKGDVLLVSSNFAEIRSF